MTRARNPKAIFLPPASPRLSFGSPTAWKRVCEGFIGTTTGFFREFDPSQVAPEPFFPSTCSGAVGLAEVARGRHGGHDEVEGDGNVHGSDVAGASTDHPNLVVGLEVHAGWAPWEGGKHRDFAGILDI